MAKNYARKTSTVENVSKVIFRFVSGKGNEVHKLSSTAVDGVTGEILDGSTLISKPQAKMFNEKYNWPIIDIAKDEDGNWSKLEDEVYDEDEPDHEDDTDPEPDSKE